MFGRKKKAPEPIYDVTQKVAKTWWGGHETRPHHKGRTAQDESGNSENITQRLLFLTARQKGKGIRMD